MASMVQSRCVQYAGGRVAMRRALQSLGVDANTPVLPNSLGAPIIRATDALGSISHTQGLAVAVACTPLGGLVRDVGVAAAGE